MSTKAKQCQFCRLVDLQVGISRYIVEHNKRPNPLAGTSSRDGVLAAIATAEIQRKNHSLRQH